VQVRNSAREAGFGPNLEGADLSRRPFPVGENSSMHTAEQVRPDCRAAMANGRHRHCASQFPLALPPHRASRRDIEDYRAARADKLLPSSGLSETSSPRDTGCANAVRGSGSVPSSDSIARVSGLHARDGLIAQTGPHFFA